MLSQSMRGAQQLMPIDRQRYPKDWQKIARSIKEAAGWRCQHCLRLCLRPGEKPPSLTRSEWTHATLSVHHSNFTPEDNTKENLIALCTPCHLAVHGRTKRSNTSPGQLSLWDIAPNVFAPRQLSLWDTAPNVFGKV